MFRRANMHSGIRAIWMVYPGSSQAPRSYSFRRGYGLDLVYKETDHPVFFLYATPPAVGYSSEGANMLSSVMLGIFVEALIVAASPARQQDLSTYVNPFIGTAGPDGTGANSGDTFPGVSVPFGVVKIGPDTTEMNPSTNAFAGYTPDGNGTQTSI